MLTIDAMEDGRLRVRNNRRSDVARDESAARAMAERWGHTELTINKALAEMRAEAGGGEAARSWRIVRPEPAGTAEVQAAPPKAAGRRARARRGAEAGKSARSAKPAKRSGVGKTATTGAPRARALVAEAVKELRGLEKDALPFARAPWSELREMAEHIVTCLDGKKPRGGWSRAGS